MKRILILSIAIIATTGCSLMSKKDCLTSDWEKLGFDAASSGKSSEQFNHLAQACEKYNIAANQVNFKKGYDNGLVTYCTFDSGLKRGSKGKSFKTMCDPERFSQYKKGFLAGVDQHCKYLQGYNDISNGIKANKLCPKSLYPRYVEGHNLGKTQYLNLRKLRHAENTLANIKKKLKALDPENKGLERTLLEAEYQMQVAKIKQLEYDVSEHANLVKTF